jgi:hypothetical protein
MVTKQPKPFHHIPERDRVKPGPQKKFVDELIRKLTAPEPKKKEGER